MKPTELRNLLETLAIEGLIYVEYFEDSQDELYKIGSSTVLFWDTDLHYTAFDETNRVIPIDKLIDSLFDITMTRVISHRIDLACLGVLQ